MSKIPTERFIEHHPNLTRLMETVGVKAAGQMLGLGNISSTVADGRVRPCYEMAAEFILGESADKPMIYVCTVGRDKADAFKSFVDALGIDNHLLEM